MNLHRKFFKALVTVTTVLFTVVAQAQTRLAKTCDNYNEGDKPLCLKMINLRSQIFALETQRELMQVNSEYLAALGRGLMTTANEALQLVGIGIPEHRQGLSGVVNQSRNLITLAEKQDENMMVLANTMRTNCSSCHTATAPGSDVGWDEIFKRDWGFINEICNAPGKNPYLCKSMYGMLSTHTYHHTAYEANIQNFELTREAAREIVRILNDLKAKGFNHLPEDKRSLAVSAAKEVMVLADAHDTTAFDKARNIITACTSCHTSVGGGGGGPELFGPFGNFRLQQQRTQKM